MSQVPEHDHRRRSNAVLRVREPGEHSRVTFFELFFDLVFVFAVTQLSHTLAEHLELEHLARVVLLLLAMWWAWMYTTWATNWLDPDHVSVRLLLTGIMLGGLIMSAALPEAFDGRAMAFALAYTGIQVGRTSFMVWAFRDDGVRRLNFIRITGWFLVSAVFWIVGATLEADARFWTWVAALAIEYLGPPTAFWVPVLGRSAVSDWNVEGAHLAERCGLFIIIALGESLLVTGATFSGIDWTGPLVFAMTASFGAAVAMWWIYFDLSAEAGSNVIAHSDNPGGLARSAYTYIHLPMVAGIILAAVGDEKILAHPTGETEFKIALTILGGPMVFLAGHWLFKRAIVGRFVWAHVFGVAALALVLTVHREVSPYVLSLLGTTVLAAVAGYGRWAHRGEEELEFS